MFEEVTDPAAHPDESVGPPEYLGVTRILRAAGCMQDWEVGEDVLERGSAIHAATARYDRKQTFATLPEWKGYVSAWKLFIKETRCVVKLIEHPLVNETHRIRGRLDRFVTFDESRTFRKDRAFHNTPKEAILEIATGQLQPYKMLQMALYGWLLNPRDIYRRIGVEISKDGKYDVHEFPVKNYMDDVQTALACIRRNNWVKQYVR